MTDIGNRFTNLDRILLSQLRMVPLLLLIACNDDSSVVEVATIWYDGNQPRIQYPPSGDVGAQIEVLIGTAGGGCTDFESTAIDEIPDGFRVTPFNRTKITERPCPAIRLHIEHSAILVFDTPGTKAIVVSAVNESKHAVEFPLTIEITKQQ